MNADNKGIDKIRHDHRNDDRNCDDEKVVYYANNFSTAHQAETDNAMRCELGTNTSSNNNNNNSESNQNRQLESQLSESSNHNELCCSVLTTVIDFVMMMPSYVYEPDEYEENLLLSSTNSDAHCNTTEENHKSPLLLVPVMRIFGPIIRRQKRNQSGTDCTTMDHHYLNRRPYQSACLYVHGAYPYMIARPTLAGLDGSCIPSNDCPWDSPVKVQQMIGTIQELLENAVQETNLSFLNTNNDSNHNATSNDNYHTNHKSSSISDGNKPCHVVSNRPILRQITVVMGRGFYGYCSGPTAPFLRIEYYNPQDRWKVKRCLEHGLSFGTSSSMLCTPEFFFPKSRFRREDRSQHDINHLDETNSLLRFHCFEAHIPYTMQFFKDYNLAGMSHLHVSEPIRPTREKFHSNKEEELLTNGPVLFRHPLPRSIRATKRHQAVNDEEDMEIQSSSDFRPWVFLESNTSTEYVWNDKLQPNHENASSLPEKMTSCDIELDIHVSNIENQFDVMTNLPSQYEDRQRTHWRAVPSLHEIWKQERRRMSKLLPPQEDFLSHDDTNGKHCQVPSDKNTPPFTLNVQASDVVVPGAKLALDGMKNLIHVTSGLDDSFRRVMQQIVHRHAKSITETDLKILQRQKHLEKHGDDEKLTPSYDDTVEALDALGNLFNGATPTGACVNCTGDIFSEVKGITSEARMSQESVGTSGDSAPHSSRHNSQTQADKARLNLSQACSSSMVQQVKDSTLIDEFVLSQRVERGDGIIGNHFENIDDVINPETLAPYEIFDDEDDDVQESDDDCLNESESNVELNEQKMTQLLADLKEHAALRYSTDDDSSVDSLKLLQRNHQDNCSDYIRKVEQHPVRNTGQDTYNRHVEHKQSAESQKRFVQPRANIGYDITPVFSAPTRLDVELWYQKQQKRPNSDGIDSGIVRKRRREFRDFGNPPNKIDEKLASSPFDIVHNVEEVDWTHTQGPQTSYQHVGTSQSMASFAENESQAYSEADGKNSITVNEEFSSDQLLAGIGNQGGRIFVERGGDMKAKTRQSQISYENEPLSNDVLQSPVSIMTIEIFVQCRTGRAGTNNSSTIAMTPDSLRDKISAILYVMCEDPGGGDALIYHERGCIFVPVAVELDTVCAGSGSKDLDRFAAAVRRSLPKTSLGISSQLSFECVRDERQLLLRLASIVRRNDPDMLLSWDTQASGLGYIIERGFSIAKDSTTSPDAVRGIDMARLLGRTPRINTPPAVSRFLPKMKPENADNISSNTEDSVRWNGSGLGTEWDDRVGAGAAASSIVRLIK